MGTVKAAISISLDGFVAGPNQSEEQPLGEGGEALHEWAVELEAWRRAHGLEGGAVNASTAVAEELEAGSGAVVMGRNMFGPVRGPWAESTWRGWWGDEPPFRKPVFVLTHHAREPLELRGGTTFHFVTDGLASALEQAREAAGTDDVLVAGGASAIRQCLVARSLDVLQLSIVPVLLGGGAGLFDDLGDPLPKLEQVAAIDAPGVTHVSYRVVG